MTKPRPGARAYKRYPRLEDSIGAQFGRLTVVREVAPAVAKNGKRRRRVECLCTCGTIYVADYMDVVRRLQSCGCLIAEIFKLRITKHGACSRTVRLPEYDAWRGMKNRCRNPKRKCFDRYGGRGIKVFPAWENDFEAFFAHVGPKPGPEYSLDRINNDGNYEPGNVRWATNEQQQKNRTTTAGRSSKMNFEKAQLIRAALRNGEKRKDLAVQFGISRARIDMIAAGKAWIECPVMSPRTRECEARER